MPGFPSNFLFNLSGHRMVLNVYVDDLTLSGAAHLHAQFWNRFAELIKIEDPQVLSCDNPVLILGRLHEMEAPQMLQMSMVGYAEQFVDLYLEITGMDVKSLRRVATPHVSDSGLADELYESTGSMKPHAAKVLMKGLWLARLARPDISYSVGRQCRRHRAACFCGCRLGIVRSQRTLYFWHVYCLGIRIFPLVDRMEFATPVISHRWQD